MTFDEAVKTIDLSDESMVNATKIMDAMGNNRILMEKLHKIAALTIVETLLDPKGSPSQSIFASIASTFTLGVAVGQAMMASDKEDIAHA
jgi:hypothetical protein